MTVTKERVLAVIDTLDEGQLEEVFHMLQRLTSKVDNNPIESDVESLLGNNIAEDFRILRRILAEEGVELTVPPRNDSRVNAFLECLDETSDESAD